MFVLQDVLGDVYCSGCIGWVMFVVQDVLGYVYSSERVRQCLLFRTCWVTFVAQGVLGHLF